jgi:hypothetical protein
VVLYDEHGIMKPRRSPIWKIDKEQLIKIVEKSYSTGEVLSYFNLKNKGDNYRTIKKRLIEDNINFSHFRIDPNNGIVVPLDEILVEKSSYTNRYRLKIRLIKNSILINICYICGCPPIWNGKLLSLQLDHINGISNDNRIENLRLLCPNCHSQTANFAGKNKNRQV